jgi:site-specific recombinase XerD
MARVGRPRKTLTPLQQKKNELTDTIIDQVKYNCRLSNEQIVYLQHALEDTLKGYELEKVINSEEGLSIKDTNSEALNAFLNSKKAEARSKTTIYNYGNELGKLFVIINKDYRDITSQDIRDYMEYRRDHDKVRPITLQNIRLYLMSFYKWAFIDERITRNPMDKIGTVKIEKKIIETFTDEEIERLRCACKSERDLAIVDMLSSSGMRVSELTNLNINNVNFETGEVKVYGKGKKERICFLTGRAKIHLKWYLESRTDNNPALFVTIKKPYNRISKNGVEYIIKELGKASGISNLGKRVHPHAFRSTLATNMLNKGADIALVQGVLGHSSPETTLQVYSKMETSTLKRAHDTYAS